MIRKAQALVFVIAVLWSWAARVEAVEPKPLIPITRDFTLDNGLHVVLSEDHSRPVASVVVLYDVGSRHEVLGKSGFAHLFEHMMFEGSENISKTEMSHYLDTIGGEINASTATDYTIYYDSVPSNMLERIMWVESDRMRSLKVTEANFRNQLETVKEEKRLSYDNRPYMPALIKTQELLFDNWANAHPTIGSFADLEASSVKDAQAFFKTHYAPNRACLAIAGDIDPAVTEQLVRKYFGTIAPIPGKSPAIVSEAIPGKAKFALVKDEYADTPALFLAWKIPGMRQPDYYAEGIIEKLLIDGKSTRLYQRLVKQEKTALDVENYGEERRGPGDFIIFVTYKKGARTKQVKQSVLDEIAKLKSGKISDKELQKAKNQVLAQLLAGQSSSSLQSSLGKAEFLAQYGLFFGNAKLADEEIASYMAVSESDIHRAAKRIFAGNSATIVEVLPGQRI